MVTVMVMIIVVAFFVKRGVAEIGQWFFFDRCGQCNWVILPSHVVRIWRCCRLVVFVVTRFEDWLLGRVHERGNGMEWLDLLLARARQLLIGEKRGVGRLWRRCLEHIVLSFRLAIILVTVERDARRAAVVQSVTRRLGNFGHR